MYDKHCKFHVVSLGLAVGVISALNIFIMGLFAMYGHGADYVNLASSIYIGYAPTFLGSIIGAIWGFIDGFIFGAILAWIYNFFCCRVCKKCGITTSEPPKESKF